MMGLGPEEEESDDSDFEDQKKKKPEEKREFIKNGQKNESERTSNIQNKAVRNITTMY